MQICFVVAPGQNHFFVELVDALRDELDQAGISNSVSVGRFPEAGRDTAFVLLPPHEFFALTPAEDHPSRAQLKHTIFICAEQPRSSFFHANVQLAQRAHGAVFDINRWSIGEFASHGVKAKHFQLGWTRNWTHFDPTEESHEDCRRSIDLLHLGIRSPRREEMLAHAARHIVPYDCVISLGDNTAPLKHGDPGWVGDDDKWKLLGDTRVLLNIHRDSMPYFEWLRIVQAISNGAMIVSDWSLDHEPLTPGEHLLQGMGRDLGLIAARPLREEAYRLDIAQRAFTTLRDEIPMADAVDSLVDAASDLTGRARRGTRHESRASQPTPYAEIASAKSTFRQHRFEHLRNEVVRIESDPTLSFQATVTEHLKGQGLGLREMRGDVARLKARLDRGGFEPSVVEFVHQTPSLQGVKPRVSIITPLFNYEKLVTKALASAARSDLRSFELVIVDDGSTDDSLAVATDWLVNNPSVPALLLTHPTNRGLGAARNSAVMAARGEFVFALDADNTVYPNGISRLLARLDNDPDAAMAYGMLERHDPSFRSVGVLSSYPWDARRFADGNYIDAMALWRRQTLIDLGLYTEDSKLWGWEDYELCLRLVRSGGYGTFEPQFVARYRVSDLSMSHTMNLSAIPMAKHLIELYPELLLPEHAELVA